MTKRLEKKLKRMHNFSLPFSVILCVILNSLAINQSTFSQVQNQKCMICHSKPDFKIKREDGSIIQLYVDDSLLKKSPHSEISCYDCHNDIVEITAFGHKKNVSKVQCTRCHHENNPVGAPETKKYLEFQESVHQQELNKGNPKAPVCQTCHGTHDIIKRSSLSPLELRKRIAQVCAKCHLDIYAVFKSSIHGFELFEKNNVDVPGCTDCHGEHTIKKHDDPQSSVYETKIYGTCGECHASEKIVEKYGIRSDKIKTYETSYHGIAVQFGEKTAANCASCHGVHDIRPQDDPASMIHTNNIVETCGKCHPDANANYTKGKIHLNTSSEEAGSIYYISGFFKWLTLITLSLLAIHVVLDLYRKLKHKTH
jgi:predicted CXXCH cytochrome family protein